MPGAAADGAPRRPRILISNDDGVSAPGLLALTRRLAAENFCTFSVCGPLGERSAQSHCITTGAPLHAFEIAVPGAEEAFAVDGTPADSVMLALFGPLLRGSPRSFDLVVSGINRGDNAGLHVIYSGTVGAAREAAAKDVPALAVSLQNYAARSEEAYALAAAHTVALIKALLGLLLPAPIKGSGAEPSPPPTTPARALVGHVVNVNVPGRIPGGGGAVVESVRGYCLAPTGQHCSFPGFVPDAVEADFQAAHDAAAHGLGDLHVAGVELRCYRNGAGALRGDATPGCDSAALGEGWLTVSLLGLRQDVPLSPGAAAARYDAATVRALAGAVGAAAAAMGVPVRGVPEGLLDGGGGVRG